MITKYDTSTGGGPSGTGSGKSSNLFPVLLAFGILGFIAIMHFSAQAATETQE